MCLNHTLGGKCKSIDLFAKELTDLQNKHGLLITEVKDGRMTIIEQATNNKILVEQICTEIIKLAKKK